ncbi:hypothetical protein [Halorussus halophilus]|nr:hypothetical protein [Halorussus halophilus]
MSTTDNVSETRRLTDSEHVCVFCQGTFDVTQTTVCPMCDAEVIVRGER